MIDSLLPPYPSVTTLLQYDAFVTPMWRRKPRNRKTLVTDGSVAVVLMVQGTAGGAVMEELGDVEGDKETDVEGEPGDAARSGMTDRGQARPATVF